MSALADGAIAKAETDAEFIERMEAEAAAEFAAAVSAWREDKAAGRGQAVIAEMGGAFAGDAESMKGCADGEGCGDVLIMDIGGTGSRALYYNHALGTTGRSEGGGGNPYRIGADAVAAVLTRHLTDLGLLEHLDGNSSTAPRRHIGRVLVGMAGISSPLAQGVVDSVFAEAGISSAGEVQLLSDAELTHIAGFGVALAETGGGGQTAGAVESSVDVVLISGTGSIAVSLSPVDRTLVRAGGLGHDHGDEGSGNWLGAQLKVLAARDESLLASLREHVHGVRAVTTAEAAPVPPDAIDIGSIPDSDLCIVIDSLTAAHPSAVDLARRAGTELTKIVNSVYEQQSALFNCSGDEHKLPCRVRCYGSVLKCCTSVRAAFVAALEEQHPGVAVEDVDDVLLQTLQHLQRQ